MGSKREKNEELISSIIQQHEALSPSEKKKSETIVQELIADLERKNESNITISISSDESDVEQGLLIKKEKVGAVEDKGIKKLLIKKEKVGAVEDKGLLKEDEKQLFVSSILTNYENLTEESKNSAQIGVKTLLESLLEPESNGKEQVIQSESNHHTSLSDGVKKEKNDGSSEVSKLVKKRPLSAVFNSDTDDDEVNLVDLEHLPPGPSTSYEPPKKRRKVENPESQEFIDNILAKFENLSPQMKRETCGSIKKLVNQMTGTKKSNHLQGDTEDNKPVSVDGVERKDFMHSQLHSSLVNLATHGGCDAKVEAKLSLDVAVISRKQGRAAHCSNKMCHQHLDVKETVVVMIGSYGNHYKKVFFCPDPKCIANRNYRDCVKEPETYLISCTISSKQRKRMKTLFPNSRDSQCINCL